MGIECVDKTINGHSVYPCPWCGYYDLYVDNICKKFLLDALPAVQEARWLTP